MLSSAKLFPGGELEVGESTVMCNKDERGRGRRIKDNFKIYTPLSRATRLLPYLFKILIINLELNHDDISQY